MVTYKIMGLFDIECRVKKELRIPYNINATVIEDVSRGTQTAV